VRLAAADLNQSAPMTPGEEGLRDIRVLEAILRAASSGKEVENG
jgi:glucose-fructose oxidoreductase